MLQKPLTVLPFEFQRDWQAQVHPAAPKEAGEVRLVGIERAPDGYEAQRITVFVIDENGLPVHNCPVAFAFTTAERFMIGPEFTWAPPPPYRAQIVPTRFGLAEQIQGSVVKPDGPGGVTVYVFRPDLPSDVVTGAGMLADHTGLKLTFQLQRAGVYPLADQVGTLEGLQAELARRQADLEKRLDILEGKW